jgi:hypothetical protein
VGIATAAELVRLGDDAAFGRLTARFAEDACTGYVAGAGRGRARRALVWPGQGAARGVDEGG